MDKILRCLTAAADSIVRSGNAYEGLFGSILNRDSGELLAELPRCLEGQRVHDRAFLGSNLMHDHFLLRALYALSNRTGSRNYAGAADRYLDFFAARCTDTPSGLFPWGEHAFYHLLLQRPSSGHALKPDAAENEQPPLVHDHLHQSPLWLWEELWARNPEAVLRFARALVRHYRSRIPLEYNRHAYIDRDGPFNPGITGRDDFPRHGGFYLFDWAFTLRASSDGFFSEKIHEMLRYHSTNRDRSGLLPYRSGESSPHIGVSQTLSLGACLLEAAELVGGTDAELCKRLRAEGAQYAAAFLAAPHEPDRGVFVLGCRGEPYEITDTMPLWSSVYGRPTAASAGGTLGCCYRLCGDEAMLSFMRQIGRCYLNSPLPENTPGIPAVDAGLVVGLFCELYDLTGENVWLDAGLAAANTAADIYFDRPLPRAATGADHYESQTLPGLLMYNILRIVSMRDGCPIPGEYAYRQ